MRTSNDRRTSPPNSVAPCIPTAPAAARCPQVTLVESRRSTRPPRERPARERFYAFYDNLQTGAHSLDFMAASHFHRPPSSSSAKTTASLDSLVGLLGKTTGAIWISFGIASILRVVVCPVPPHPRTP